MAPRLSGASPACVLPRLRSRTTSARSVLSLRWPIGLYMVQWQGVAPAFVVARPQCAASGPILPTRIKV
jgi:hypothetical protein